MVFRACLGSSLGLIIGLTISFFMVEVVNGKHVKNPLQRMQLKQKQRNNMILKRYKSQKSFLVPKCFIFWKFESFSKKASISRFPTWIFWKNHRETTSRKSEGETASTKCPCFTHRSCMKAVPKILHFLWFCSPSSPKKLKPMNSKGSKDQVKLKGLKSIPQQFSIRSPEKLKLATGKSHWYICIYYIIYIYLYIYIVQLCSVSELWGSDFNLYNQWLYCRVFEHRGPVPEHVVKRIVDFATMNPTYKAPQNDGLFGWKRWDSGGPLNNQPLIYTLYSGYLLGIFPCTSIFSLPVDTLDRYPPEV